MFNLLSIYKQNLLANFKFKKYFINFAIHQQI